MEEWRKIEGYENYEISSFGNVRRGNKILKPFLNGDGYAHIQLCKDGIRKRGKLSRFVANAFIPNLENKPTVDHINKIRNDDRVENLRWATHSEQTIHSPVPIGISGHRCIHKTTNNTYEVEIRRNHLIVFKKRYKTLPEAINARDEFLSGKIIIPK